MSRSRLAAALGLIDYVGAVERAVGDAARLLDVGCGNNSPIGRFQRRVPHSVGVDKHTPWLEESRARGIHDDYLETDVLNIDREFGADAFEVVLACDLLEHLSEAHGTELLEKMEEVASERVVVLTPNGYVRQEATWGNPYQIHRSGWKPEAFEERGYTVSGLNGLKVFRGERGQLRLRPARLWSGVSQTTQLLAWRRPEWAFHILAVKTVGQRHARNTGAPDRGESSRPL